MSCHPPTSCFAEVNLLWKGHHFVQNKLCSCKSSMDFNDLHHFWSPIPLSWVGLWVASGYSPCVWDLHSFERRRRTKAWNPSGCEGPGPGTLPLVFLVHHGSQGSLALAGETYAQCPLPKSYWDISVFQYSSICVSTSKEIDIPQKY